MKWILILSSLIYLGCKKKIYPSLEEIALNSNLSNEVAILQIVKKVLGSQFKEFHIEKEDKGFKVLVEFGGKTALTFASKGGYEKELKLFTAYYAWKIFRYASHRNLNVLTLSLVKPYYVYHPELEKEIIQEVEVFRVKIQKEDIQSVPFYQEMNLEIDSKNFHAQEGLLNSLEFITKIWKVELDEFKRVELK